MQSNNGVYNLDENADYLNFVMGGFKYRMRYPTVNEVFAIQTEADEEKVNELVFALVTPEDEGTPPFKETTENASVKALTNFGQMLQHELAISRKVV